MRVSIITGGGSGIGAAVARRLAAPDPCLMLHGQGADAAGLERLKAVAADCRACRRQCRVAHRRPGQGRDGIRTRRRDAQPRSAASMRSSMPRALRTGAASRSCRARASNGRSPSWPSAFHELASAALPDLTRGSQGRVVAISQFRRPSVHARGDLSGVRRRPRPRWRRWSGVLRSSSQARAQRPMSSCPAIRARMPG